MELSENSKNAIPVFLIIIFVLYSLKPHFLFGTDGKPKNNGLGSNSDGTKKTVFSMNNLIIILAFISWFIFKEKK